MRGIVYLLTNLVNGKYYIGQTRNWSNRKWAHRRQPNGTVISNAICKYGWENFAVDILGDCQTDDELDATERLWILLTNSTNNSVGYNIRPGGDSVRHTEEMRMRNSEAQKKAGYARYWLGKKRPDMSERNRIIFTGKPAWNSGTAKPKVSRAKFTPEERKRRQVEGLRRFLATPEGILKQKRATSFRTSEQQRESSLARWNRKKEVL